MRLSFLKSKIHRAVVTDARLDYEGSISIDPRLCEAARLHPFERVEIYNCNNGARIATYVIHGQPGEICLNGAAARHAQTGDRIIIACQRRPPAARAPRRSTRAQRPRLRNLRCDLLAGFAGRVIVQTPGDCHPTAGPCPRCNCLEQYSNRHHFHQFVVFDLPEIERFYNFVFPERNHSESIKITEGQKH